ncbi:hypothetical protein CRYUN_Cryun24cG0091300 [Craigia yunnanensis]
MFITNCTVVGPLPLLLLATEIALASTKGNDDNDDDGDDNVDGGDDDNGSDDGDVCDTDGDDMLMVMHPRQVFPPVLGASIYAIACILSYDGLSGISTESVDSPTLRVRATDINKLVPGRGVDAVANGIGPSSCNEQAPVMSVGTSLDQASSQGPISVASSSGVSKLQGPRQILASDDLGRGLSLNNDGGKMYVVNKVKWGSSLRVLKSLSE